MTEQLSQLSSPELFEAARSIRDASFGRVITYSPKAFFPVTMLCRDRCGYCTFAKAPAKVPHPYLPLNEIRELAQRSVDVGVREALLTLGERPEQRYLTARRFLESNNLNSTIEYVREVAAMLLEEFGLLPHPNAGALYSSELSMLREVSVSQGMMVESLRGDLQAHRLAPDKTPRRRLNTLRESGKLRIPFTTGLLVGIGETEEDRIYALGEIASIAREYGHIQEVIIQNFLPKAHTAMADTPPPTRDAYLRAIALARLILPPNVHVQAPPNLNDDLASLTNAGIDDLGGISPITVDHVNPERPWPHLERLQHTLEQLNFDLAPRCAVHPRFVRDPSFFDPEVYKVLLRHIDSEGYAREENWYSGGKVTETLHIPKARLSASDGDLEEIFRGVESGSPVGATELQTLFQVRGNRYLKVLEFANALRQEVNGETVTYVSNRNINYTNICTFKCRFCAFSKGPMSLNLRGTPYLMSFGEIVDKVLEAEAVGATEVCLQGGIHPSFDGQFYIEVVRAIKKAAPNIHIHAFSALEIDQGAGRLGVDVETYLKELAALGLKTLPGTAAEILDDEVRRELCPDKISASRWLEIHETAHSVGLRSNVTIMFGSLESPESWVRHLLRTREVQRRTGGFTEFVPLPFVHMASPIYLAGKSRRGPTLRESLLMHAVGRIAYHRDISNIQASWVKMGPEGAQALLRSGANDLGGTLMEENISHAAGSEHGRALGVEDLWAIADAVGRPLAQRNTLYKILNDHPPRQQASHLSSPHQLPSQSSTSLRLSSRPRRV